jgi:glycine/D-amino acid oxidase-like deaminating enzyme
VLQHYAQQDTQPSVVPEAVGLVPSSALDITFTATSQANGDLLLGSSRDGVGFDDATSGHTVRAILEHSQRFLPSLDVEQAREAAIVRVGLRPHAARGLPLVGSVPGVHGLFMNAGHSGSGLILAPVSAALTAAMLDINAVSDLFEEDTMRAAAALLQPPAPWWDDATDEGRM